MSETTYCQRNKLVILNRTKRYYHDNIKLLREKVKNKYRELSEEEIRREYGRNGYPNMSEGKKEELKEYQWNYRKAKESTQFLSVFFFSLYQNEKRVGLQ